MSDIEKEVAARLRADAAEHQKRRDAAQAVVDKEATVVSRMLADAIALEHDEPSPPVETPPPADPQPAPVPVEPPAPPAAPAPADPPITPESLPPLFLKPGSAQSPFNGYPTKKLLGDGKIVVPAMFMASITGGPWSLGVYLARPTDPPLTIKGENGKLWNSATQTLDDSITLPHWPADAVAAPGTGGTYDGHCDVVYGNTIHSFYRLAKNLDGSWQCAKYSKQAVDGPLWSTPDNPQNGPRATGCVASAGLIRIWEVEPGVEIEHALSMSLAFESLSTGFVAPATSCDADVSRNTGTIPEGALLFLPDDFDETQGNEFQARVIRCLKKYGAYVTDRNVGSPFVIYVEMPYDVNAGQADGFDYTAAVVCNAIARALRPAVEASGWIGGDGKAFSPSWLPQAPPTPAPPPIQPSGSDLTIEGVAAVSKLHFGIPRENVTEAEFNSLRQSAPDYDPVDLGASWAAYGANESIGIVTASSARWAATLDPRAEGNMVLNAKAMRWVPIHISATEEPGQPIKFWLYPNKSTESSSPFNGRPADYGVIPDPVQNPNNISPDAAHERHPLYLYAILCQLRGDAEGFAFALREFKWLIGWQLINLNSEGRGSDRFILIPQQPRAAAWSFATLLQFAAVCPHDDEWFEPTLQVIRNNIDYFLGMRHPDYPLYSLEGMGPYAAYDLVGKNSVGLCFGPDAAYGSDSQTWIISAFQHAFFATTVMFGQRLGLPLGDGYAKKFDDLAAFVMRWVGRLFGPANDPNAFDYRRAGMSTTIIGMNGKLFANDAELLLWNGGPVGPEDFNLRGSAHVDKIPYSYAYSNFDNVAPALEMGADFDPQYVPSCQRLENSVQWKEGGAWPFSMTRAGVMFPRHDAASPAPVPAPGPATPPAPAAPAPADPVAVAIDLTKATRICGEGDTFTMSADATVYYGANDSFFAVAVLAGKPYVATNVFAGGDPIHGVAKAVYYLAGGPAAPMPPASPPPAPAPGPAPAAPAPSPATPAAPGAVGIDTTIATKLADEGSPFTLAADATIYYGAGESFFPVALKAGTYTASNALTNGSDPAHGVAKAIYLLAAGQVPIEPPAPPPPPPPVAPTGRVILFRDVRTTNTPSQALAAATTIYPPPKVQDVYNCYGGIVSFPADLFDGWAAANSGHGTMFQCLLTYNRGTKTYAIKCVPPNANGEGNTDALNRFPDDSLTIGHGYGGAHFVPPINGYGPRWVQLMGYGLSHVACCLDINADKQPAGLSFLNATPYVVNGATVGQISYPMAAHWVGHGYFIINNGTYPQKTFFQAYDGSMDLTSYDSVGSTFFSGMEVDAVHGHLLGICPQNADPGNAKAGALLMVDLVGKKLVGNPDILDHAGVNSFPAYYGQIPLGKFGWVWVAEHDCAYGYFSNGTTCTLVRLRPTDPANRTIAAWVLELVNAQHDPEDTAGSSTLRNPADSGGNLEGKHLDWDAARKKLTVHVAWNAPPQEFDFTGGPA